MQSPHACTSPAWWSGGRICGHRGSGADNAHRGRGVHALENSLLSFELASSSGALDLVELDVMLSRDGVPVVHHDWCVLVRAEGVGGVHVPLRVPVGHLTLAQLAALQPQPMACTGAAGATLREGAWAQAAATFGASGSTDASAAASASASASAATHAALAAAGWRPCRACAAPHRVGSDARALDALGVDAATATSDSNGAALRVHAPACGECHGLRCTGGIPTLEAVLRHCGLRVGVNVELKHPTDEEEALLGLRRVERSDLVARVLDVVARCCALEVGALAGVGAGAGGLLEPSPDADARRAIVFSSFDPEVCALARRAQAVFPVLFLTEGGTQARDERDVRMNSLAAAFAWARAAHLHGVVTHAPPVVNDVRACVAEARGEGGAERLLLFTYGAVNNDCDNVLAQLEGGVDCVILDHLSTARAAKAALRTMRGGGDLCRWGNKQTVHYLKSGGATNRESHHWHRTGHRT